MDSQDLNTIGLAFTSIGALVMGVRFDNELFIYSAAVIGIAFIVVGTITWDSEENGNEH